MAYIKTTWADEVLSGAERYDIKENGGAAFKSTMQVVLVTAVTTPATPVNATNMNHLEQGVADAFTALALQAPRTVTVAMNGADTLTTATKAKFRIPAGMTGMNLIAVSANCGLDNSSGSSSSGVPQISVQNGATNMLSTNLTIDAGEYDSATAATAAVIDTAHDDIATNNIINVEIVAAGTGVTYLLVTLEFVLP